MQLLELRNSFEVFSSNVPEKIFVGSDVLDDGRLISTIEIVIAKTDNQ